MRKSDLKRILIILFFIFVGQPTISDSAQAATLIGEFPTGLIQLEDVKYPVYLYVPENVKPGRRYPLIISLAPPNETAEDHVKQWTSFADRTTTMVLVPTSFYIKDVPYTVDKWMFQILSLVSFSYPVNPEKKYLVGVDYGAVYAGYLGINFPEEFSAVALLDGSWVGSANPSWGEGFEELLKPKSRPAQQIPFYVALREGSGDLVAQTNTLAARLEEKGYLLEIRKFPGEEDFTRRDFQKDVLGWLDEKAEVWNDFAAKDRKTFSEKLRRGIKQFFRV